MDKNNRACMCSYFSMLEMSILSIYILALQYVKAFPAGAVHLAHRMPNAFLVG